MADSVTEAVTSAPAGEPGEVAAKGKDALEKRPKQDNRHALHNGAPTPAVLPNDVLAFLEVAMPGTFPADAAGGTPVVTVVQETNESVSAVSQITKEPTNAPTVVEAQETPVHAKPPVTKPDTSSVGLSPEVLSFLDMTLIGVAEPETTEDASQAAPVTPASPQPHVTTSYTVRDGVPQASSAASVEPKISDEVVVQDIAEGAAAARQEIPPQVTGPGVDVTEKVTPTVQAEEEVAKTEAQKTAFEAAIEVLQAAEEEVHMEEVPAVPVEEVNMAQEVVYQEELAAVRTAPEAQEDVHKEKEAPKAEVEDIAPAKTAEPEEKPSAVEEPAAVVEEPASEAKEPATEAAESKAEVKEPTAEVKEPAVEEVTTEPAAEVTESAEEVKEPETDVTKSAAEDKEPETEVKETATEAEEAAAVTVKEEASEPEKTTEVAEEAAPTADADKEKKPTVAANTEWTEEQVKEWSQEGYVPMVKNMFLPSTMPVLPSPLFYIGVGVLAILVFYLTESPIMALMTLVLVLVLILLARLFYLYRLHARCAAESASKKKSE